ncbi:MAG: glycine/betaine/sarcosine/D-proline family reductase selenoprotein B [Chloroflexi bacterium]|nr:glycine/betaine/sarcosine/D-proline family reductase selenoprotein B [Chloroflexota bacterium]
MPEERGANFAQIERDHVRSRVYAPFDWHPFDRFSPYNPLRVPLREARVAFVTTAGAHLPDQPPFDTDADAGDPSWRSFPVETPLAKLMLSHGGYDTRRASADKNVVLPLDHLRAFAQEGRIGSLAPNVYSFMGYVADTDRLLREEAPVVAERLIADGADLVLLAPT